MRDIFDRTSKGKLKEISAVKSRMTLREHTRRHTFHGPLMDFILMFLMNDSIDKEITVWDDMFLPTELEMVLDRLEYESESGKMKNIVKDKYIYYESETIPALPDRAPAHWPYTLIIGLIFGVIAVFMVFMGYEKLYYIFSLLIGLIFGFIGTLLFLISLFTDHTVTYYNENLFYANPVTLLLFLTSILVLKNQNKSFKIFYFNWLIVLIIAFLGIVVKIFPSFDQNNIQALTLILPIIFGSFISAFMLKKRVIT